MLRRPQPWPFSLRSLRLRQRLSTPKRVFLLGFFEPMMVLIFLWTVRGRDDDVFTSRNIQISGALKEDDLADLVSVIRHGRRPQTRKTGI
jgi:hypothetical protein